MRILNSLLSLTKKKALVLKLNDVNPLSVFGLRQVDHCPPHFVVFQFDLHAQEKTITDWIWENLEGRFFFGDDYISTTGGGVEIQKIVGFEIPGEASYFSLLQSTFNTY